jgi:Zn-dependent metalloprotease
MTAHRRTASIGLQVLYLLLVVGCSAARGSPQERSASPPHASDELAVSVPSPVQTAADFSRANPESRVIAGADGNQVVHASGFSFDTGAAHPADAAARFLTRYGSALGVTERQKLRVRSPGDSGEVGAVRVERSIDGMPVFGGDLVLGVSRGSVFLVNTTDVPPNVAGSHQIGEDRARAIALASVGGGARGTSQVSVAAGWRPFGASLRAVYRVDFAAQEPAGDWRVFVDGESGATLFVENRRVHAAAPGKVFEVSPAESASGFCPLAGNGGHASCESPVNVTLDHLVTGQDLTGTQTSVQNCRGANAPTDAAHVAGACAAVDAASGRFDFPVDATGTSRDDDFAAAMAYYHVDRHVSFFKGLDPALPGNAQTPPSLALNGSLPSLVNVMRDGAPFENAAYSPLLDAMLFGQGAMADFAYDATVMYHELTHGVVSAWGGFDTGVDALGGLDEPSAVNEGTADAMAVAETGRSAIGAYLAAASGNSALRDISDPSASRTCQGDGTTGTVFGVSGVVQGLDGEVHDDGRIWSGLFWEVFEGLRAAGVKGCGGACEAAPAIQYLALRLAAGTSPKLGDYWQTMKAAASSLFPAQPEVATYVDCVAKRRKLDQCDRTVPVYAGETRLQFVRLRYSPFQLAVTNSGDGEVDFCSLHGFPTTIHARKGQPVQLTGLDPRTLNATVASDRQFTMSQACDEGSFPVHLESGAQGTWYFLFDAPAALVGSDPGFDLFKATVGTSGVAVRPAGAPPGTCTPPSAAGGGTPATSGGPTQSSSGGCGTGVDTAGAASLLLAAAAIRWVSRRAPGRPAPHQGRR